VPTDQTGFAHGVASGEVTRTSVRLWTHWTGPGPLHLTVRHGDRVVTETDVVEEPGQPHVFRAVVDGLAPDVRHAYEFAAGDGRAASGSFRTLPPDGVPLRFAVVSCAKFNAGFFNTYKVVAARDDLHFVLHLGDYIYEAGQVPRGTQTPSKDIGRPFEPFEECLTFDDYMTRYAQYRRDPDLLALHARHAVWQTLDDHELADNAWSGGSEDHHEETDGPWAERMDGALRAWEYWMPSGVRPSRGEPLSRTFSVGDLVRFVLLETRTHRDGRDVPPERRSALGPDQRRWVEEALRESPCTWTFVACPSMLSSIHDEEMPDDVVDALRTLKLRHSTEARPYHDRWDSFPGERDWLYAEMGESTSEVVVLSGDVHIAIDADLESAGRVVAHEWTTSSITSQNLGDKKGWARNTESLPIVAHLVETFPDLHWADTDSHGFLVVTVDGTEASCEWWGLDTVAEQSDVADVGHRATLTAPTVAG
jgi:alkaline phosphatase D